MEKEKQARAADYDDDLRKSILPFIVNRAGAGLIDLALAVILTTVFMVLAVQGINSHRGHIENVEAYKQVLEQSHLFDSDNEMQRYDYDRNKYEEVITYFYSNDIRALNDRMLDEYAEAKRKSALFDETDYSLKANASEAEAETFYVAEYEKALSYFAQDPAVQALAKRTAVPWMIALIVSLTAALSIVYLAVPLITVNKVTLGQKFNRLMPVDYETLKPITNKRVVLRFLVFTVLYFFLPLRLFPIFGDQVLLLTVVLIAFNVTYKYHRGLQDLLSFTVVIDGTKRSEALNNEIESAH